VLENPGWPETLFGDFHRRSSFGIKLLLSFMFLVDINVVVLTGNASRMPRLSGEELQVYVIKISSPIPWL
jgi:hypothetical protein